MSRQADRPVAHQRSGHDNHEIRSTVWSEGPSSCRTARCCCAAGTRSGSRSRAVVGGHRAAARAWGVALLGVFMPAFFAYRDHYWAAYEVAYCGKWLLWWVWVCAGACCVRLNRRAGPAVRVAGSAPGGRVRGAHRVRGGTPARRAGDMANRRISGLCPQPGSPTLWP